jgi:glycosyltransferase involved in cell wall biosynthesis
MLNPHTLISVIVPAYNAQSFVSEAIESVSCQTWTHWELIVVNDGSTDGTANIVSDFSKKDPRIRLIHRENGKLAKARNTGIASASAEFIAFLDADDVWAPDKLTKQIAVLEKTGAAVVFSDAFHFAKDFPNAPTDLFGAFVGFYSGAQMFGKLYARNAIPVSSVIVRRKGSADHLRFDESPDVRGLEDYEMWLRLSSLGASFFGISEKLVGYRSHDLQMSRHVVSMLRSAITVRQKYRSIARQSGIDLVDRDRLDQRAMAYCSANIGEYRLASSTILGLCNIHRFGFRGLINAMGATAHLMYHIILGH